MNGESRFHEFLFSFVDKRLVMMFSVIQFLTILIFFLLILSPFIESLLLKFDFGYVRMHYRTMSFVLIICQSLRLLNWVFFLLTKSTFLENLKG